LEQFAKNTERPIDLAIGRLLFVLHIVPDQALIADSKCGLTSSSTKCYSGTAVDLCQQTSQVATRSRINSTTYQYQNSLQQFPGVQTYPFVPPHVPSGDGRGVVAHAPYFGWHPVPQKAVSEPLNDAEKCCQSDNNPYTTRASATKIFNPR
jgi:hypothetical protein